MIARARGHLLCKCGAKVSDQLRTSRTARIGDAISWSSFRHVLWARNARHNMDSPMVYKRDKTYLDSHANCEWQLFKSNGSGRRAETEWFEIKGINRRSLQVASIEPTVQMAPTTCRVKQLQRPKLNIIRIFFTTRCRNSYSLSSPPPRLFFYFHRWLFAYASLAMYLYTTLAIWHIITTTLHARDAQCAQHHPLLIWLPILASIPYFLKYQSTIPRHLIEREKKKKRIN